MDRDRYLELLADWTVLRNAEAAGAALGIADASLRVPGAAALRERAQDLVEPARLDAIVAELGEATGGVRPARLLELVVDAAADLLVPEAAARVAALRREPVIGQGSRSVSFEALEAWLVQQDDPAELRAHLPGIEAAAARVGEAERERGRALVEAASARSLPPAWKIRARARDRSTGAVEAWARAVLEVALPLLPLARGDEGIPVWLALPRRLGARELGAGVPEPDLGLAAFLCERLGVQRLRERRVRLDLADRTGKPPRDLVVELPEGHGVLAARRPLGRLRDYRGQLRLLGKALSRAGLERATGTDRFRADPGLDALHGALLEGQLLRPAWHERALGRVPPEAVREAWWVQGIARTARLAAEVAAAGDQIESTWPSAPVAVAPGQAAELPLLVPEGTMPWSASIGEARDELAGRLVAVAVDDLLSRRWGSAWSLEPGAGALLRDLWAAGHPTLGALCSDLGLDAPGADAALDVWASGPA